jgi:hypothetical protein
MKKLLLLSVLFTFSFSFLTLNSEAQWICMNGPNGAGVGCITCNDSDIYIGSQFLYHSTENDTLWKEVTNLVSNMSAIMIYGSKIIVCNSTGIHISQNNGVSWSSKYAADGVGSFLKYGTSIYASTWQSGILISNDTGNTWIAANTGLSGYALEIGTLAACGTNIFAGTSVGVYLSTNNGTNWSPVNTGLSGSALNVNRLPYAEQMYLPARKMVFIYQPIMD